MSDDELKAEALKVLGRATEGSHTYDVASSVLRVLDELRVVSEQRDMVAEMGSKYQKRWEELVRELKEAADPATKDWINLAPAINKVWAIIDREARDLEGGE